MRGEYWVHEDGYVDFADGDIGDYNHEGIVIRDVQNQIINKCEQSFRLRTKRGGFFSDSEYIDWDEFKRALAEAYAEDYIQSNPKKAKTIKAYLENDPNKLALAAFASCGIKKPELDTAEGIGDARDYAMKYWRWKTYRDGNIDTWLMTKADLDAIINGIEQIADESGWSDKRLNRMSFNLTVFATGRHFSLTLEQMKKWLQRPDKLPQMDKPQYDYLTAQAEKQIRDMEIQKMHPAYRRPGVNPIGDSAIHSFKDFLRENK